MRVSKTGSGVSPKEAKVSNQDKDPVKVLDEEREFLAKTLGELLAWYWWKSSATATGKEEMKVME